MHNSPLFALRRNAAPPKLDAFNTDRRLSAIRYSDYRNSDYRTTLKRMCGPAWTN
jgi:glycerol-3-phosphate dehydrogenase